MAQQQYGFGRQPSIVRRAIDRNLTLIKDHSFFRREARSGILSQHKAARQFCRAFQRDWEKTESSHLQLLRRIFWRHADQISARVQFDFHGIITHQRTSQSDHLSRERAFPNATFTKDQKPVIPICDTGGMGTPMPLTPHRAQTIRLDQRHLNRQANHEPRT